MLATEAHIDTECLEFILADIIFLSYSARSLPFKENTLFSVTVKVTPR